MPLYDTLGESAIEYVMAHSETKFVVAAGSKLASLAKSLQGFKGQLLGVAYSGDAPEAAKQVGPGRDLGRTWDEGGRCLFVL